MHNVAIIYFLNVTPFGLTIFKMFMNVGLALKDLIQGISLLHFDVSSLGI